MSIELMMPSSHLILCCPLLLLPSIFPSIRVFSNESVLHIRWPKYWSFSFNISPSSEHPGLISFRTDWFDLLAVQETLKSLFQHHSSKALILLCSAFFIVQLLHPKGDQSWVFTGRTDVEAETPILWPPDGKSWLIGKDPDAGKDWGQKERGRDGWMASLTRWTWVCADSRSWWWTGRPGMLRFMGLQRVGHDWMTELNWTIIKMNNNWHCKNNL